MPDLYGYEVEHREAVKVVDAVLDSPVQWIDTANAYGNGRSERRIGEALTARMGLHSDFIVATKVGPRGSDYSGPRVRKSVHESMTRLGVETLPLVYLHDPEYHSFEHLTEVGGAVDTLLALREEGLVGHIGVAGGDSKEISRYVQLGHFEVVLVHSRWTLVDRSAHGLIELANEQGVAVVNASVYGGGILANPGTRMMYGYRKASSETLSAIAAMDRACRAAGIDLKTAALQASVNDSRITSTVVGITRPERLQQMIASLSVEIPLDLFDELAELRPSRSNWLDFS